ncbi:HAMP domain-containing histidine kinase [Candidatus Sumerlaeota bacterium]|nr:HAMP domain-containing histidine kinase [Candidatus Sumerlaeota bacterium]
MRPRLLLIYLTIVLAPLGVLAALGIRMAQSEHQSTQQQIERLLRASLDSSNALAEEHIASVQREMQRLLPELSADRTLLRETERRHPRISQIFLLDNEGTLFHPSPKDPSLTDDEWSFIERTRRIWLDKDLYTMALQATAESQSKRQVQSVSKSTLNGAKNGATSPIVDLDHGEYDAVQGPVFGWYPWFWGRTFHFICWYRDPAGNVIGAELNRSRFLADLIARLPQTNPQKPELRDGLIRLVDSEGRIIYQWGMYRPKTKDEEPVVWRNLSKPLNAWRFEYFASLDTQYISWSTLFNIITSLFAGAMGLAGLAIYFYYENTRELRDASQRVSFVNQVSHELKTPLTNIRMYAELLDDELFEENEKAQRYAEIIALESQRLTRLINNVLSFSRQKRQKLTLQLSRQNVDETIRGVIENFEPSLAAAGIECEFRAGADAECLFDCDAIEQIIGNLLNNVEKYAAQGKHALIESRKDGSTVTITVTDRGPGIPMKQRVKIFEAFYRVNDGLTDGATGTGIGLWISRELARKHDGDLTMLDAPQGASFELTFRCQDSA